MKENPKNQIEAIEHVSYIVENGRFLGIRGTESTVINLYKIDNHYAQLSYDRKRGFITGVVYSNEIINPELFRILPL